MTCSATDCRDVLVLQYIMLGERIGRTSATVSKQEQQVLVMNSREEKENSLRKSTGEGIKTCIVAASTGARKKSSLMRLDAALTADRGRRKKKTSFNPIVSFAPEDQRFEPRVYVQSKKERYASSSSVSDRQSCNRKLSDEDNIEVRESTLWDEPYCAPSSELGVISSPTISKETTHSSTATQEQRARCGCRGITVQVNSGSLGLSLEANYVVDERQLKRTWSDWEDYRDLERYDISVEQNKGEPIRDTSLCGDWMPTGRDESKAASSGLIKVTRVNIETGKQRKSGTTVESPLSQSPAITGNKPRVSSASTSEIDDESLVIVPGGMLAVDEGDILVRVDRDQVRKRATKHNSCLGNMACTRRRNIH